MQHYDLRSRGARARGAELARAAYDAFAPVYDRFTDGYEYERWLTAIEEWALAHGLRGRDLLDVGCGTGKSFIPMLARGYRVTACDLSAAMVAEARRKAPGVEVRIVDMRRLPWRSQFDLVTCLDDTVNYLLTADDLAAAFLSVARALRPGGIAVFDTNSLGTYRSTFAEEFEIESGAWRICWRGEATNAFEKGGIASATVTPSGPVNVAPSHHVQRHWPLDVLRAACERAGFNHVAFRGQRTGGRLVGDPDEVADSKVVCLAKRSATAPRRARSGRSVAGKRRKEGPVVVKT